MDALIVELKRPREKISKKDFNEVLNSQLDDHIALSSNPTESVLFGAVGIGLHVQFYSRKLPRGHIHTRHSRPYHLLEDASYVQEIFDNIKSNVTQGLYVPGLATEEPEISTAPTDLSTSYATASSSLAPESSTNPAPDASTSYGATSQYYLVREGVYYFSDNGNLEPLASCPESVDGARPTGQNLGDIARAGKIAINETLLGQSIWIQARNTHDILFAFYLSFSFCFFSFFRLLGGYWISDT